MAVVRFEKVPQLRIHSLPPGNFAKEKAEAALLIPKLKFSDLHFEKSKSNLHDGKLVRIDAQKPFNGNANVQIQLQGQTRGKGPNTGTSIAVVIVSSELREYGGGDHNVPLRDQALATVKLALTDSLRTGLTILVRRVRA